MAKQDGLIRLTGKIDGILFYRSGNEFFARRQGQIGKERFAQDAKFERSRENVAEFVLASRSGKLIRDALGAFLFRASDNRSAPRLLKVLSKIKKFDSVSPRGQRLAGIALNHAGAKALLKGFDFNKQAPLQHVLLNTPVLTRTSGVISIKHFVPATDVNPPPSATHVSLRSAWTRIDFINGIYETYESNAVTIALNKVPQQVLLIPAGLATGNGRDVFVIKVEFFQAVNGTLHLMNNGKHNSLGIVEVL